MLTLFRQQSSSPAAGFGRGLSAGAVALGALLGASAACAQPAVGPALGEVWRCGVDGAPPVTFHVAQVESYAALGAPERAGSVYHLTSWIDGGMATPVLAHGPFDAAALDACALSRVGEGAETHPNFADGYARWRAAWDGGEAGVFAMSPTHAYFATLAARR